MGYVWQSWVWVVVVGYGVMVSVLTFLFCRMVGSGRCNVFNTLFFLFGVMVGWFSMFAIVIVAITLGLVKSPSAIFTLLNFSTPTSVAYTLGSTVALTYFIHLVFLYFAILPPLTRCEDYSYSWKPLKRYFTYYICGVILGLLTLSSILLVI